MTSRRRRGLTPEDTELWAFVTREVTPLKRRRRKPVVKAAEAVAVEAPPPAETPPAPAHKAKAPVKASVPKLKAPTLPPIALIDRHERRQVVRGTRAIEARIDLHGMRQAEAHGALRGFLSIAQMRGYSMVLVITGKGASASAPFSLEDERGVLRRVVPQWLRMADMRALVMGFEEAHQGHGGSGALYVRLRRIRGSREP